MFFTDFLVALLIAALLTGIFAFFFGSRGPWGSVFPFFLVILLAAWAGGIWVAPMGPVLWGARWVTFLIVGITFAVLLLAVTERTAGESTVELESRKEREKERSAAKHAITAFFWFLVALLVVLIAFRYF